MSLRTGGCCSVTDKKSVEELEAENTNLGQWVEYLKGVDAVHLASLLASSRAELANLQAQAGAARAQLEAARAGIVQTDELALLQEVGIYQYRHPLDDAVAYQTPRPCCGAPVRERATQNINLRN